MTKTKPLDAHLRPNELVRYALGHKPGSEDWTWALNTALFLAGRSGRGRGRPRKDRWSFMDEPDAMWLMAEIREKTGEARPYLLARMAVETGRLDLGKNTKPDSHVRRLAQLWKSIPDGWMEKK
jgi:hypothetical protein